MGTELDRYGPRGPDVSEDHGVGSTLPRRQLGRALREAREGMGLSLEQAAKLMEWGKSTLGRLEKGQAERVRVREIDDLCQIYGLPDEQTGVLKTLATQASTRSWWYSFTDLIAAGFNTYLGLEAGAARLSFYQPLVVPGLLQTAEYARAMDRVYFPDDDDIESDRRIELRIRRQAVLARKRSPAVADVIVHENVLRTVVGSPKVMAAQLRRLADIGTTDNVSVRVLPFHAGLPLGVGMSPFVILDFASTARGDVEPTVVFAENYTGGMYFEDVSDVARYRAAHRTLGAAALPVLPSRSLLRETARRFDSEQ
ncbi:helix-turn-helix domain-containing protein [Nocardia otitidiscaviarum]|nr:helix-turn-helix domain-containing protein [Nocardia otitidiscaviarum]